jgi:hypothetical protein
MTLIQALGFSDGRLMIHALEKIGDRMSTKAFWDNFG